MSDTPAPETEATEAPKKKKGGKLKKLVVFLLGFLIVGGGGAAGGMYALTGSVFPGAHAEAVEEDPNQPQLVVREGVDDDVAEQAKVRARRPNQTPDPRVFQPTYIPLEGNFTSNLSGGDAFVQIGLGVATFYDERVGERLTLHNMAIRSAVLMTLSEQDPAYITTLEGKEHLKGEIRNAINNVLTNREGFGGIDDVYFTSFVTQ